MKKTIEMFAVFVGGKIKHVDDERGDAISWASLEKYMPTREMDKKELAAHVKSVHVLPVTITYDDGKKGD